ncbi:MAG: efflux RND transporter periplasmic adaptor subunit [Bacteroidetes bacterium]|jgi:multidrug efflux pump subunit AcrA (membrane-fusion protein)|nr:efflux RND transporter periplasmic adaptor subunit [Bacteroidota bacterium]
MRVVIILSAVFFSACTSGKKEEHYTHQEEYTCSMHPQVIQDKPGTCPICGMELVKKSNGGNEMVVTEDLKDLIKPTNASVVAKIQTIHPERKTLEVDAVASGIVNYDTRRTYSIPVRFGGRIEKLYLKYNYQPVKKGQVIMEVYSPELLTAQRELLYVFNQQKEDTQLLDATKQKLLLLGLTKEQIEKVIAEGKETFAFPVLSPYTGYIIESTASSEVQPSSLVQPTSMGGGGMGKKTSGMQTSNAMGTSSSTSLLGQQISIREGMYITTGQSLFKVVDGTRLWAELYFPAGDGKQIRKGNPIELRVNGLDGVITSSIDFIQPFFSEGKQFLQVRSYVSDKNNVLRVGQLVTARLNQPGSQSLWIPKIAVLDLGVQQIVFIKDKGTFTPFRIKTGSESSGWIEVMEGLSESSEIAANAQYLVDSESFIKVKNP